MIRLLPTKFGEDWSQNKVWPSRTPFLPLFTPFYPLFDPLRSHFSQLWFQILSCWAKSCVWCKFHKDSSMGTQKITTTRFDPILTLFWPISTPPFDPLWGHFSQIWLQVLSYWAKSSVWCKFHKDSSMGTQKLPITRFDPILTPFWPLSTHLFDPLKGHFSQLWLQILSCWPKIYVWCEFHEDSSMGTQKLPVIRMTPFWPHFDHLWPPFWTP